MKHPDMSDGNNGHNGIIDLSDEDLNDVLAQRAELGDG